MDLEYVKGQSHSRLVVIESDALKITIRLEERLREKEVLLEWWSLPVGGRKPVTSMIRLEVMSCHYQFRDSVLVTTLMPCWHHYIEENE